MNTPYGTSQLLGSLSNFFATLCLILAVLLGSTGEGWSNGEYWHEMNCRETFPERIYDQYFVEGYLFTLIDHFAYVNVDESLVEDAWTDPDCFDKYLIVTKPYASRSSGAPETFVPWFLDDPLIVETYARSIEVFSPRFITDTGTYFIVSWHMGGTAGEQITVYTVAPHFQKLADFSAKGGATLTNDGIIIGESVGVIGADGDFCSAPGECCLWRQDIHYTFHPDRLVARKDSNSVFDLLEIVRRTQECGLGWRSANRSDYESRDWDVPLWLEGDP